VVALIESLRGCGGGQDRPVTPTAPSLDPVLLARLRHH
jgi:hypothetical protein